jgi:hypothetical protein
MLGILAPLMPARVFVREPLDVLRRPGPRAQQEIHFDKNLAMIGGVLVVVLEESGRQRRGR